MKNGSFLIVGSLSILVAVSAGSGGCSSTTSNTSGAGGSGDGGAGSPSGSGASVSTVGSGAGGAGTGGAGAGTGGSGQGGGSGGSGGSGGNGGNAMDGGPAPQCTSSADCRLFSSSCGSCECIPLLKSEKDPICNGNMVNCLVDPCQGHAPQCDAVTGQCVVN